MRKPSAVQRESAADAALLAVGDPAAFGEVYRRHRAAVRACVGRLVGCAALADDLAADTFVIALRQSARFDGRSPSARAWLLGIARNTVRRAYRQSSVEQRAGRRLDARPGAPVAPDDLAAVTVDAAVADRLRRGLAALAPGTRAAVVLRVVERAGYDEIAEQLGCSPGAARTRVCRGLAELASDERLRSAWERSCAL